MMALSHERSIRCLKSVSHTQIACCGDYLAVPRSGHSLEVWGLNETNAEPLVLDGHRRPVTGLCFCYRSGSLLLCSAADDYIILWSIDAAVIAKEAGQKCRGHVVSRAPGAIGHVTVDSDCGLVAACVAKEVYVINLKGGETEAILEGHTGHVNAAEFCPHYSSTLVTISNDRTFKIWGLSSQTLIYQSSIISSSPFISLAMNPLHESFSIGTIDGQIRVYDLTDQSEFRCLHHLDVNKLLSKIQWEKRKRAPAQQNEGASRGSVTISSRPSWQKPSSGPHGDVSTTEDSEVSCSILSMLYTSRNLEQNKSTEMSPVIGSNNGIVRELLDEPQVLIVGTTGSIMEINSQTMETMSCISLLDPLPSHGAAASRTVSLAGNIVMARSRMTPEKVWCIVGKIFDSEVDILSMWPSERMADGTQEVSFGAAMDTQWWNEGDIQADRSSSIVSVLSSAALSPTSLLKAELIPKSKEAAKQNKPTVKPGVIDKNGRIVDNQPITFHTKIKSSGYTAAPRRPVLRQKSNNLTSRKSLSTSTPDLSSTVSKRQYPILSGPPNSLESSVQVSDRQTSVNCIQLSERGDRLATALSNTSAAIFNCSHSGINSHDATFSGHSQALNHVGWSHDGQWLITSSDDQTAKLWMSTNPDPLMTMANIKGNIQAMKDSSSRTDKENLLFPKAVRFGQFFFVDRFFILSSGNSFHLYKYYLDANKSDLKRYASNTKYKLVKSFQLSPSQQISSLSAINSFHSYLVLCSGIDKSLEVFDLNVGSVVQSISEVHRKPVHAIVQNKGSPFASQSSAAYDLFLTSAVSDGVKLWDLRSNRCVRLYSGHLNRIHPCGCAFSPCGRYVASGSEDKSAYIFDIRSGGYVERLTGHSETVIGVLFNPRYPQLITSTLDGCLKAFSTK